MIIYNVDINIFPNPTLFSSQWELGPFLELEKYRLKSQPLEVIDKFVVGEVLQRVDKDIYPLIAKYLVGDPKQAKKVTKNIKSAVQLISVLLLPSSPSSSSSSSSNSASGSVQEEGTDGPGSTGPGPAGEGKGKGKVGMGTSKKGAPGGPKKGYPYSSYTYDPEETYESLRRTSELLLRSVDTLGLNFENGSTNPHPNPNFNPNHNPNPNPYSNPTPFPTCTSTSTPPTPPPPPPPSPPPPPPPCP